MSTASVAQPKGRKHRIPAAVASKSLAATTQFELLRFLERSIGEKTEDYLRKLALRDARTQSIADSSRKLLARLERLEQSAATPAVVKTTKPGAGGKRQAINGMFTLPKSVLSPGQRCVRAKFAVTVSAVYGLQRRLNPGTVLFRNTSLGENGAFTLSFPEIEEVFKVAPTMFSTGQVFNAEVISANLKNVKLQLVEDISANGT